MAERQGHFNFGDSQDPVFAEVNREGKIRPLFHPVQRALFEEEFNRYEDLTRQDAQARAIGDHETRRTLGVQQDEILEQIGRLFTP